MSSTHSEIVLVEMASFNDASRHVLSQRGNLASQNISRCCSEHTTMVEHGVLPAIWPCKRPIAICQVLVHVLGYTDGRVCNNVGLKLGSASMT